MDRRPAASGRSEYDQPSTIRHVAWPLTEADLRLPTASGATALLPEPVGGCGDGFGSKEARGNRMAATCERPRFARHERQTAQPAYSCWPGAVCCPGSCEHAVTSWIVACLSGGHARFDMYTHRNLKRRAMHPRRPRRSSHGLSARKRPRRHVLGYRVHHLRGQAESHLRRLLRRHAPQHRRRRTITTRSARSSWDSPARPAATRSRFPSTTSVRRSIASTCATAGNSRLVSLFPTACAGNTSPYGPAPSLDGRRPFCAYAIGPKAIGLVRADRVLGRKSSKRVPPGEPAD